MLAHHRAVADFLPHVQRAMLAALRRDLLARPVLPDSKVLLDYLRSLLAFQPVERVCAFYLDAAHALICEDVVTEGTVTEAPFYPREIVHRALDLGAVAIIIVHNHPSGDTAPSHADTLATDKLCRAARCFDIAVLDHIIIGERGHTSLRALGLVR